MCVFVQPGPTLFLHACVFWPSLLMRRRQHKDAIIGGILFSLGIAFVFAHQASQVVLLPSKMENVFQVCVFRASSKTYCSCYSPSYALNLLVLVTTIRTQPCCAYLVIYQSEAAFERKKICIPLTRGDRVARQARQHESVSLLCESLLGSRCVAISACCFWARIL